MTNYKGKSKGYAYVQFKDEVRICLLISAVRAQFVLHCIVELLSSTPSRESICVCFDQF